MSKSTYWALGIFAFVLALDLAYRAYHLYLVNRVLDDLSATIEQATHDNVTAARDRNQDKDGQVGLERLSQDSFCAMNSSMEKCACIHKRTQEQIPVPRQECVARASAAGHVYRD